jgi:hypothetical protein
MLRSKTNERMAEIEEKALGGMRKVNVFSFALLLGHQMSSGPNVVAPGCPPMAVRGGNVVAVIEAVRKWEFRPARDESDKPIN